jgi:uncharacterized protein (DUF1684 family)
MGGTARMGGTGGIAFVIAGALALGACSPGPPDERDYASKLRADRAAKDAAFAASDDPIPRARHAEFLPLAYFPIDPDYNVPATLKPISDPTARSSSRSRDRP